MSAAPIFLRELGVNMRRSDFLPLRNRSVAGCGLMVGVFLILQAFGIPVMRNAAAWIALLIAAIAAMLPVNFCLGMVLEERVAQTFPLLRLAGVSARAFWGAKAAAAFWIGWYQCMGLVPLLALPFLAGGLTFQAFTLMLSFALASLCASIGLSLLCSTLARDETAARAMFVGVAIVWCLSLPLIHRLGRWVSGTPPFGEERLWISPFYAAVLLDGTISPQSARLVLKTVCLMFGVGLSALGLAAAQLSVTWNRPDFRQASGRTQRQRWSEPTNPSAAAAWNPIEEWVASEVGRVRWCYVSLVGFGILWGLGAVYWRHAWLNSLLCLLAMGMLALAFQTVPTLLLAAKVSRERVSGALAELLLTPLDPVQIVDGYVLGTWRLYRPLRRVTVGFLITIWLGGAFGRSWSLPAFVSYALLGMAGYLIAVHSWKDGLYQTFRRGVISGRFASTIEATGTTLFAVLLGNAWNLHRAIWTIMRSGQLPTFPSGGVWELAIVTACTALVWVIVRVETKQRHSHARVLAIKELRPWMEQPPLATDDPRWKNWDKQGPIPFW